MRSRTSTLPRAAWALPCLLVAACSDPAPATNPSLDVTPPADDGTVTPPDVAPDVAPEAAMDAAPDALLDAADDAAPDVAPDLPPACPAGLTQCGAACVDLQRDGQHCGACAMPCAAGLTCRAGACELVCPGAQAACAGACVSPMTDPQHCGACGRACAADQVCAAGVCACPTGQTRCGDRCVDAQADARHCGGCDMACAAGQVCAAGRCETRCPTGQTVCSMTCVTTATDALHCGRCANECPAGARCAAGSCACPAGQTACGDACVDTAVSRSHCGMCGRACSAAGGTAACVDGACFVVACDAARGDCDRTAANGCEAALATDGRNCGACGNACATGMCMAGACVGARTCAELHAMAPTAPSGQYPLDPDGPGGEPGFTAYCDMTTDGGGWTYLATVTNSGDAANMGNWLVASPSPNNWESTTAFGTLDPTANQDYRSAAFHRVAGQALMVTHRNRFLLRTDNACLGNSTLRDRFARLGWTCGGSQDFSSAPACTNACVIAQATPQTGDTALLAGTARTRLFFKAGEADGAQDTNRDRAYLSTNYRDNVDYPTGLGAFCSGSSCSPRTGEADVNDRSDAITPSSGAEFYGLWIR
jgi:hypothetical protein